MDTIATETCCEQTIKKSRFIAYTLKVTDELEFRARLDRIQSIHPGATHYVYAYCIRDRDGRQHTRFTDDGEPRSSAGKPVMGPILAKNLSNTAVVVVRFFGGIKLGVGGLVRAYGGVAAAALEEAGTARLYRKENGTVTASYASHQDTERRLINEGARIVSREFSDIVIIHFERDVDF